MGHADPGLYVVFTCKQRCAWLRSIEAWRERRGETSASCRHVFGGMLSFVVLSSIALSIEIWSHRLEFQSWLIVLCWDVTMSQGGKLTLVRRRRRSAFFPFRLLFVVSAIRPSRSQRNVGQNGFVASTVEILIQTLLTTRSAASTSSLVSEYLSFFS